MGTPPTTASPVNHVIAVYDDASVSAPVLRIRDTDTVEWVNTCSQNCTIEFSRRGCPFTGGPNFPANAGGHTGTANVSPNAAFASYKYTVRVGNKVNDPSIDIKP